MKITSFNPFIATKDAAAVIQLFEQLGFEKAHIKANLYLDDATVVRMKDANGYCVDVTQVDGMERDMTGIRMNVDNFEEAYDFLTARGFTVDEEEISGTATSRFALMRSPSGFILNIVKHVRK